MLGTKLVEKIKAPSTFPFPPPSPNIPAGPRDKNSLRNNCSTFPRPELTPVRGHQGLRGTLAHRGTLREVQGTYDDEGYSRAVPCDKPCH